MEEVGIIIINWNGRAYLADCLDSLKNQTFKNFKTFLVDNGSSDDSVSFISENFPEVEIIRLEKNTGFAHANNIGIGRALSYAQIKYVLFLNNDTIADKIFLESLVNAAKNNSVYSAFQPKVLNFCDHSIIDNVGIALHRSGLAFSLGFKKKTELFNSEMEIFAASATASLFSCEDLKEIKRNSGYFFDNDFFAYYEDVDLGWRLRLSGRRCLFVPNSEIYHHHSATGCKIPSMKLFLIQRNSLLALIKNLPSRYLALFLISLPFRYLYAIFKYRDNLVGFIKILIRAWLYVILNLFKIIRKRKDIQSSKKVSCQEISVWFKKFKVNNYFF